MSHTMRAPEFLMVLTESRADSRVLARFGRDARRRAGITCAPPTDPQPTLLEA